MRKQTHFPFPMSLACKFTLLYRLTAINTTQNRKQESYSFPIWRMRNKRHSSAKSTCTDNGKWEMGRFLISHLQKPKWEIGNRSISHFSFTEIEMGNEKSWVWFPFPIFELRKWGMGNGLLYPFPISHSSIIKPN